ncbi:MAG: AMP-binding protein [Euryarchaeota archaeon]|nr:AMP-binding protein [Euryarchaeota archaeon]
METLAELLVVIRGHGERAAVLSFDEDGERTYSCDRLADQAERLAHGILDLGIERETPVGILSERRPEWGLAAVGVLHSGATLAPIDAEADDDTLRHILDDSGIRFLFTTKELAERIDRLDLERPPRFLLIDTDDPEGLQAKTLSKLLSNERSEGVPQVSAEDRAVLFYTSGTTGAPKGVPLTHHNIVAGIQTLRPERLLERDDRVLVPLPFHHIYPFTLGLLVPLTMGVPIVIPRSLTPDDLRTALHDGRATLLLAVPRLLDALVTGIRSRLEATAGPAGPVVDRLFTAVAGSTRYTHRPLFAPLLRPIRDQVAPHLRMVASGGAPLDPETAWTLKALGWQVAVGYGLTETAPVIAFDADTEDPKTVGRPVDAVDVQIDTDIEEAEDDGKHDEGEILVRGETVFEGYHGLPEKNKGSFTGDGWFRTGDLGRIDDDGRLVITGRRSTRIVTAAGETIDPTRLEAAFAKKNAIREAGVLEHEGRPVAVIVPDTSATGDDPGETEHAVIEAVGRVSRSLPEHSRPADHVVTGRPLERTRIGKIRRKELEKRYAALKEGETEAAHPVDISAMETKDRRLLDHPDARAAWDLLTERFEKTRLTPDSDPRYDLGVDSIDWLEITQGIARRTGVGLDQDTITSIRTVRDLLQAVREGEEGGPPEDRIRTALEEPGRVLDDNARRWLEPLPKGLEGVSRGLRGLDAAMMRALYNVDVEDIERLPRNGALLLAPNHTSHLDPFVLDAALPADIRARTYWLGWEGLVTANPVTRTIGRIMQTLPAGPARPEVALAYATEAFERDGTVVWFPEGSRSTDGDLQRLRPGIGHLLSRHDVPIVPVAIYGTHDILPVGRTTPRLKGRVRVRFGEPVGRDTLLEEGDGDDDVERIVDALHGRLERLIGESPEDGR